MTSENYNIKQKQVYFRAYQDLSQLENSLELIKKERISSFQISILGKVEHFFCNENNEFSKDSKALKINWKDLLGNTVNFGSIYNPQIGTVFIVGSLVSTFLYKINGKSLAALSSMPYGILRGIGANEAQANNYLKLLGSGSYVLIIRDFEGELENHKKIL